MSRAIGPDISFYQDDNSTPQGVDFDKMKAAPSDFVIIRVGQNTWLDSDYRVNWLGAKAAGIPRGSYWFYDSRSTPQSQAKRWIDALENDKGELPLFADFEERYGGVYAGPDNFLNFLEELERLAPEKEIIIYTGYYYWKDNVPDYKRQNFGRWELWAARYDPREPMMIEPWEEWTFWQYTEHGDGLAYGVESLDIDLNYYNGTPEEFRLRFGLDEVDSPIDPPAETLYRMTTEESGAIHFDPVEAEPEEPQEPEPIEMQLVTEPGKIYCKIHRTADDGETKVIHLDFVEGTTVFVTPVPQHRIMMKEDGTTHKVLNWETEADFENINKVWASLIIQKVQRSSLNWKWLHPDWTDDGGKGNWDTTRSYIKRIYLKEISEPEPPAPSYDFHVPSTGDFVKVNHDWEE